MIFSVSPPVQSTSPVHRSSPVIVDGRSKELRKSINAWPFLLHVVSKTIRGGNLSSLESSCKFPHLALDR